MRNEIFENDFYYHIYNRGNDKRNIFLDEWDFLRFLKSLREFNDVRVYGGMKEKVATYGRGQASEASEAWPLVELTAYCLNRNHYHLIIKQKEDGGITKFMQRLGTAYVMYFNTKHKRSGSLFQGPYKSIKIDTMSYLGYLSAYINGNPEIHGIAKADEWKWSSCLDYLGKRKGTLCDFGFLVEDYRSLVEYDEYMNEVIIGAKEVKEEFSRMFLE